ncbi:MAG: hypothetical protein CM1200mP9_01720 [Gammaproteobacteria bacterium]|nr:MAG: hypothetical protein CM1200mP9_01720 [Gammaproteobacteria bacterium]
MRTNRPAAVVRRLFRQFRPRWEILRETTAPLPEEHPRVPSLAPTTLFFRPSQTTITGLNRRRHRKQVDHPHNLGLALTDVNVLHVYPLVILLTLVT